jgi:hypothetical protein
MRAGMVLSTRGPNPWGQEPGGLYCPVSVAWGRKNAQPTLVQETSRIITASSGFPVDPDVVKLKLSGFATERAPSWDRPRDHFQDETPGAGHV